MRKETFFEVDVKLFINKPLIWITYIVITFCKLKNLSQLIKKIKK